MELKVLNINDNKEYICYGFVHVENQVYSSGICYNPEDTNFKEIPSSWLKPIINKSTILNERAENEKIRSI